MKNSLRGAARRHYKNILIVRLDRIGDVVLSTPVIKAMRDAYPDSRITFMATPYSGGVVKGNPYLDEVISYDKDKDGKGFIDNIRYAMKLRRKMFDLALILHPTARSHMLIFLSGIPDRVGYDRKCGCLLTRRVPHTKQLGLRHETDYALELSRYAGAEASARSLYVPLSSDSESRIIDIFHRNGISVSDTVVVMNPGASCPSKRWGARKFASVADLLVKRCSAKIVIISDLRDKALAGELEHHAQASVLNLAGSTSVSDVVSVLKKAKLFISNDSGPVHIACALGVPVVAIFGRSDRGLSPARWGPLGKRDIVLHKDAGCPKCAAHNCSIGFRCLELVTADEVTDAAVKLLGSVCEIIPESGK